MRLRPGRTIFTFSLGAVLLSGLAVGVTTPAVATEHAATFSSPSVDPAPLPDFTIGQPYSYAIAWTGDGIHVAMGNLPAGLSLSRDGVLSGTPTSKTTGTYTFTLSAYTAPVEDDQWPETATRTFTVNLNALHNYTEIGKSSTQWSQPVERWAPVTHVDLHCPAETPYLINQHFAPLHIIPHGILVETTRDISTDISADKFTRDGYQSGAKALSAANHHSTPQTITVTLHCTNAQNEARPA